MFNFSFFRKAPAIAQPIAQPSPAQPIVDTQAKFRKHRIHVPVLRRNDTLQLITIEYLDRPVTIPYSEVVYDFGSDAWVVSYAVTSQF